MTSSVSEAEPPEIATVNVADDVLHDAEPAASDEPASTPDSSPPATNTITNTPPRRACKQMSFTSRPRTSPAAPTPWNSEITKIHPPAYPHTHGDTSGEAVSQRARLVGAAVLRRRPVGPQTARSTSGMSPEEWRYLYRLEHERSRRHRRRTPMQAEKTPYIPGPPDWLG